MISTIIEIKRRLRLAMNGVVSSSMRERGYGYKLNFGVAVPTLAQLAVEIEQSRALALQLWAEDIRECRLLATMIYPIDQLSDDDLCLFIDGIKYADEVDHIAKNLLSSYNNRKQLVFKLLCSDSELARQLAYALSIRIVNEPSASPLFISQLLLALVESVNRFGESNLLRVVNLTEKIASTKVLSREEIKEKVSFLQVPEHIRSELFEIVDYCYSL